MSNSTIYNQNHSSSIREFLKWILVLFSIFAIGHWLYLGGRRFFYLYEMSWMEGSMLDQILRVLQGKSIYTAPSIEYVPWLYQPFYYIVSAGIAKIMGLSFITARVISFFSTIISGSIIVFIVYKETNKNIFFSLFGVGLFFAAYGKTGYSFEVARVDSLFLALLLCGSAITIYAKQGSMMILGAFLLALSYFTKQSALLFLPGIAFLLFFRSRKDALLFSVSTIFFILGGIFLLHTLTAGWYEYYTLEIPSAKRKTFDWLFGISEFLKYVILRCWLLTVVMFIMTMITAIRHRTKSFLSTNQSVLYSLFLAALFTALLGLGNEGGGKNVLMPLAAFSAIILPIITNSMLKRAKNEFSQILFYGIITAQFVCLFSNPYSFPRNIPTMNDEVRQKIFLDSLHSFSGDVWIPYHGFMPRNSGKQTFAELRAYGDVLLMNDGVAQQLKRDLDSTLLAHRFSYIYDEVRDTFPGYVLKYSTPNLHKAQVWTDTMIYVFVPDNN